MDDENKIYPIPKSFEHARTNERGYAEKYRDSIENNEHFWAMQGGRLNWIKPWDKVKDCSFEHPVKIGWYLGGKLNVTANCIDRHLPKRAKQTAIIWEADDPKTPSLHITYRQLSEHVNRFANSLKELGVKKGDRVTIYMPMVPEAAYALLACARIGAVHSVVFGGFSPDSLVDRIIDCDSTFVITADEGRRAGKPTAMKKNLDVALEKTKGIKKVLVVKVTGGSVTMKSDRDIWYHDIAPKQSITCEPEVMDAEDPLFILYTSGSTGKPKGVLHTTAGYLVFAAYTHEQVFDYKDGDIYWCTADVGWVTGHSYIVYGPLANGATTLMFEGVPTYPTASRMWEVVDKHKVNTLYTSPTAIRALMGEGDAPVDKTSRDSLRLLGCVGEPLNPEAWRWFYEVVGNKRCPIVDTWWQTETGGHMITPLPGATPLKAGSPSFPFFGVEPVLMDEEGNLLEGAASGNLAIKSSWPGQMRTVYKDHARFEETYFKRFPGYYNTGDGCRRDVDGYYWITGRVDDVINVSGHRLGTAEIESALVAHTRVSEAVVVGTPHKIKGQGIYAYVTLNQGVTATDELKAELVKHVRAEISPIATPDYIQWAPQLPKTRSGKIMRRILRKIAENKPDDLGDTSTLSDPGVVQDLVNNRLNR